MKFSIIIPIFNAEKYIYDSVNSVLTQTYKDFEIVLVDDGSTDNSASICDSMVKKYYNIIKVVHQKNKGQLFSRCVGAEIAEGDYCVYLDSDDIIYADCLEVLSNTITDFENPDMVVYNFERLTPMGERLSRPMPLKCGFVYEGESKKDIYNTLIEGSSFNSMWNKCIKRECLLGYLEKFSDYRSLRCGEDRLQVLESVTRANRVVCIEDILYCYRLFEGSITRNSAVSHINKLNMKKLYEMEKTYLLKWDLNDEANKKTLKNRWLNETMYTFSRFYENAKTNKERKQIVDFDWDSFLPADILSTELGNSVQSKLYHLIKEKKYMSLRIYFLKKVIYGKYKQLKARLK